MLQRLSDIATIVSKSLSVMAMGLIVILVLTMVFEVISRRFFGAPTLWAYDIAVMTNGAIFLLGGGFVAVMDRHVRIDFLAVRFSERTRHTIWVAVELLLIIPAFVFLTHAAITEAWRAYAEGQVERVSPWAPVVWPYYCAIAVGLIGLTLQVTSNALTMAAALLRRNKDLDQAALK